MEWVYYALGSAFFLSILSLVQKRILNKEHALQTLVTMTFLCSLALSIFVKKVNFDLSMQTYGLLYLKAVLLSFSWVLLFKAYRHMEISSAEPMKNLSPLFLVIFAMIFLGERISILNFVGILIIVCGAYIIQVDHSFTHVLQNLRALKNKHMDKLFLSLILVSFSAIIDKLLVQTYQIDKLSILFFVYWMMFVNLFFVFSYKYNGYHGVYHLMKRRHVWIILVVVARLLAEFSYFHALTFPGVMISLLIPVKRLSTLFTTVIGGEVFHDHGLKTRIIGCCVALVGAVFVLL